MINNGGRAGPDTRETLKQGHETTLTVNYLGHYLLTKNLLPLIKESESGRIVNVSSAAYEFYGIDIGDMQMEKEGSYGPLKAYSHSKLMQIMMT